MLSPPSWILTWPFGREQPGSSLFYRRACHNRNSFPPCKLVAKTTEAAWPEADTQYPACDNRDGADNLVADDTSHHYILFMWFFMLLSNELLTFPVLQIGVFSVKLTLSSLHIINM
jgi:hypothetical protein